MKKTGLVVAAFATSLMALATSSAYAQDWHGAYAGGSLNFDSIAHRHNQIVFDTNLDGKYGDTVNDFQGNNYFAPGLCDGRANDTSLSNGCSKSHNQIGAGLRVGYDWQSDHIVYGLVGEVDSNKYNDTVTAFSTAPDTYTFNRKVSSLSALRGRLGYAHDSWLFYGTAGFAWANIDRSFATTNAFNTFTATNGRNGDGTQIGLGVEKRWGEWTVGVEYLRTSLKDRGATVRVSGNTNTFASNPFLITNPVGTDMRINGDRFDTNSVMITINYRFGAM